MATKKTLFIVRHGKSSWKYESIDDIDRHLKERGILDAYNMAKRLKKENLQPELIISSPAARAFHTATIFARSLNYPPDNIQIQGNFYPGDMDTILQVIRETNDDIHSVMIFGHNPAFTDLANLFLTEETDKIPTAGIATVHFDTGKWKNIGSENVNKVHTDYPKKQK